MEFSHKHTTFIGGYSCSVIINETVIVFGGGIEKQISIIYPSGIKRVASLPFTFHYGRCHIYDGPGL
mgnify:CR=1 FL=1